MQFVYILYMYLKCRHGFRDEVGLISERTAAQGANDGVQIRCVFDGKQGVNSLIGCLRSFE